MGGFRISLQGSFLPALPFPYRVATEPWAMREERDSWFFPYIVTTFRLASYLRVEMLLAGSGVRVFPNCRVFKDLYKDVLLT